MNPNKFPVKKQKPEKFRLYIDDWDAIIILGSVGLVLDFGVMIWGLIILIRQIIGC